MRYFLFILLLALPSCATKPMSAQDKRYYDFVAACGVNPFERSRYATEGVDMTSYRMQRQVDSNTRQLRNIQYGLEPAGVPFSPYAAW